MVFDEGIGEGRCPKVRHALLEMEERASSMPAGDPTGMADQICTKAISIKDVFVDCPDLINELAAFMGGPEVLFRQARILSRSIRHCFEQQPFAQGACRDMQRMVCSRQAIVKSDRRRSTRLVLSAIWLVLIGVISPTFITIWAAQSKTLSSKGRLDQLYMRSSHLSMLAIVALILAICLPSRMTDGALLHHALEVFGTSQQLLWARNAELHVASTIDEQQARAIAVADGMFAAMSSITASGKFMLMMKRGLCCCSFLGFLSVLKPLFGSVTVCSVCCCLLCGRPNL